MDSSGLPPTYIEGFHNKESVLKMKYKRLGNTDMYVSLLSFGGGAFSKFYSAFNEEEAIETIREAIRNGVNYIDTAPWYGQGTSETVIGKALKGVPRKAYYIGTKVGRYELNFEDMFDFTAEKTVKSFDKSLELLGLEYVDIIQVHDVEFASNLDIVVKETLASLKRIQESGRARYIGVTGYSLSVLCETIKRSDVKIDTILTYCRNTLIDSSLDDYVNLLKDVGIICAAAHGMGLLTNAGPPLWHPASDSVKVNCKAASDICKSQNIELGRMAISHAFKNTDVATNLVGMNCRELLHSNLSVLYDGLTKEETELLKKLNEKYFNNMKNTQWENIEVDNYWKYMNNLKK